MNQPDELQIELRVLCHFGRGTSALQMIGFDAEDYGRAYPMQVRLVTYIDNLLVTLRYHTEHAEGLFG